MQSTPNLRDTDPHDMFVIEPDVSLASRTDKAPLDLLYDVLSRTSDPAPSQVRPDPELRIAPDFSASAAVPSVDAAARPTVTEDSPVNDIRLGDTEISAHQPATSKLARRAVMGLFALGSAIVAAAWQNYGDDAKAMMARYAPPFSIASLVSPEKPAAAELPAAAVTQASATDQAAAQTSPATASAAPDQTGVIQSMARDLAAMGQQIGELKATVEQLKASQAQMASVPARTEPKLAEPKLAEPKLAEPKLAEPRAAEPVLTRPRIVPPPTHSTVTALARRPKQTFPYAPIAPAPPPPQAAGATPTQVQAAKDGGPVVRPPMPLH